MPQISSPDFPVATDRAHPRIVGTGRSGRRSVTLYRSTASSRCGLCGGPILRSELHSRLRVGVGDGRYVVPVCRECVPFTVVELLETA